MNSNPVDLRRVHWYEGLFLKPEHFRRQDGFAESLALWGARYGSALFGLVGAGPRGAGDPADAFTFSRVSVIVTEGGATAAAVEQVRGITPAGAWIDVPSVIRATIPTLDPDADALLYVVRRRTDGAFAVTPTTNGLPADAAIELADAAYELTTRPAADDAAWAIVVGRLRRRGNVTEPDDQFIPACAFVSSHAALREQAAGLRARVSALEIDYAALHGRLREITALARRAAVELSDDYEDMLNGVRTLCDAIGDCALALADRALAVPQFVAALGLLTARSERMLRITPSLTDYLGRTALTLPWADIQQRITEELRGDENLADRVAAAKHLCNVLEGIHGRVAERCDDYRVHRRYRELRLAIDRQPAPKRLYMRVSDPVGVEAVSSEDVRFRFTNLSLDHRRSYIAILFGAGDDPLADRDYIADVFVNDKEQRRDIGAPGRRVVGQANLAIPIEGHGEPIRHVVVKIPGGGPFGNGALYALATAQTATQFRQQDADVAVIDDIEYVTIKLTGHDADRAGKAFLERTDQVRVRMFYHRPQEKGGKGARRLFEVIIRKGNVWSCSLSERERNDPRFVCRWNESDSLVGLRSTYDFPELPRCVQIGIADTAKGATWFLKCLFKVSRENNNGVVQDAVAARLQDVSPAWPIA